MNIETEIQRELWLSVRHSYESSAWSNAILDAIYFLSDAVRTKTGLQSDGTALAGQALGGKNPKLRLNRLQTESEQSIQQGVEQLLRGTYQAIRNPRSHGRIDDTQADADAAIFIVNYLLRVLGAAQTDFAIDTCVQRVLEDSFVPNERYAILLANEIPLRQRLQVALTVYQRKKEGNGDNLEYFFSALLPLLTRAEQDEFCDAVSAELRQTMDDTVIAAMLQCLPAEFWPRLDELARLRVENRIVRDMGEGRYDLISNRCLGGAMARASKSVLGHFSLKSEALAALADKLRSRRRTEQDYVFTFFFSSLALLADKPTPALTLALLNGLKAGNDRFLHAINASGLWSDQEWTPKLQEAIANFEAKVVRFDPEIDDDDEVPF
jgi:uncharacterized protein (TIGR02391 family)